MTLKPCVLFDCDGTLVRAFGQNGTTRGPRTLDEIEYLPGVREGCKRLRDEGYLLAIVSNQPDVARKKIKIAEVRSVTSRIVTDLQLDGMFICTHDTSDGCCCRKPRAGLVYTAMYTLNARAFGSFLIGDRESDAAAALDAGITPVRVETNQGIEEAVKWILEDET